MLGSSWLSPAFAQLFRQLYTLNILEWCCFETMGPAASRHITRKIFCFEEQEKHKSAVVAVVTITFELNGLWLGVHHGSLNVPLNITQPLGIWSIMATIRWCSIFPKWDSYQPLFILCLILQMRMCRAAKNNVPCYVYPAFWTYSCLFPLAMKQNTWYFWVYLVSWRNQIQNKVTWKKIGSSRFKVVIIYSDIRVCLRSGLNHVKSITGDIPHVQTLNLIMLLVLIICIYIYIRVYIY